MNFIDIAIAKGYTEESLMGAGALKGDKGETGDSAYIIAVNNGFEGTEEEWLESLKVDESTVKSIVDKVVEDSVNEISENISQLSSEIVGLDKRTKVTVGEFQNVSSEFEQTKGYIDSNGVYHSYDASWCTDFLNLNDIDGARISTFPPRYNNPSAVLYDVDKKFVAVLSNETLSNYEIDAVSIKSNYINARFVRFISFIVSSENDKTKIFRKNTINSQDIYDELTEQLNKKATFESDEKMIIDHTKEIIDSLYISANDGKTHTYTGSYAKTSNFIEIDSVDVFYYSGNATESGVALWAVYDELKTFVASIGGSSEYANVSKLPINVEEIKATYPHAKYIRFTSIYSQTLSVISYTDFDLSNMIAQLVKQNVLFGKKYVACGDSFTAGDFGSAYKDDYYDNVQNVWKTYAWHIADRNNMKFTNMAKSGADFTNISGASIPFSVDTYKKVPADADYITLMFGLNEYAIGDDVSLIGTKDDTTNNTLWGAYNVVFEYLLTNMPYAKIGVIIADAWMNKNYADAVKEICAYWGVPYLDLKDADIPLLIGGKNYIISSKALDLRNKAFKMSDTDAHPNPKAHEYRSTIIEAWLRTL